MNLPQRVREAYQNGLRAAKNEEALSAYFCAMAATPDPQSPEATALVKLAIRAHREKMSAITQPAGLLERIAYEVGRL